MQNGHNISTEKIREIHSSAVVLQLKVIIEKNFLWAIPRLQSFHKKTGGPRDNLWLGWGEGMTPLRVLLQNTPLQQAGARTPSHTWEGGNVCQEELLVHRY